MHQLKKEGADFRHTLHGSPQTTTIYGKTAPIYRGSFYNSCSFVHRGVCEAIEQICLAILSECEDKDT